MDSEGPLQVQPGSEVEEELMKTASPECDAVTEPHLVREESLLDVIGSSKPVNSETKDAQKKRSTLKRVLGMVKPKKGDGKQDKGTDNTSTDSSPASSKTNSLSRMFQRVANRPSVTRLLSALGGGGSGKEKEGGEAWEGEAKAGSSKTLGRFLSVVHKGSRRREGAGEARCETEPGRLERTSSDPLLAN